MSVQDIKKLERFLEREESEDIDIDVYKYINSDYLPAEDSNE